MLKYHGNLEHDIANEGQPEIQVCLDEVNRGGLFGNVFVAAVIWNPLLPDDDTNKQIKDSKRLSKKKRHELRKYIEQHAIDYAVCSIDNRTIDEINILQSTYKAMHECLNIITARNKVDRILVDGNRFPMYKCYAHQCVIKGDNEYIGIASASILAKCSHDDWLEDICRSNNELDEKYKLLSNRGYGTKAHILGIKEHGISNMHRKSFCKKILS